MKELYSHCSTSVAARILGLSPASIQKLMDKNELLGWRTNGGHRRILLSSIESYQDKNNIPPENKSDVKKLKILLLTANKKSLKIFEDLFSEIDLPLEYITTTSAIETLIDIRIINPNIIIIPALINGINGFEIAELVDKKLVSNNISCIVYSESKNDLKSINNLSPRVATSVINSLNTEWFKGFLSSSARIFSTK